MEQRYNIHDKALEISWLDGVHPDVHTYLNQAENNPSPLRALPDQTFTVSVLTTQWCERINKELHRYDQWLLSMNEGQRPPNSMHDYGVILVDIGFEKVLWELTDKVMFPLISKLYPEINSHQISEYHAFSVQYGVHGDRELGFHVDASEVTVNICLGETWKGGDLYFQGRRCALHRQEGHRPDEHWEYRHTVGEMIVHAGKHRHGVHRLESGFRRNIIIWYSTGAYEEDIECPSWCQHKP